MNQDTSRDEESAPNGSWMKLGEAAAALGVSEITLRRNVKGGKIPHNFRDGRYYVFMTKDPHSGSYNDPRLCSNSGKDFPTEKSSLSACLPPVNALASTTVANQSLEQDAHLHLLNRQIMDKDEQLRSLRRVVEDQATLIGFLENSFSSLANRKKEKFPSP